MEIIIIEILTNAQELSLICAHKEFRNFATINSFDVSDLRLF